VGGRATTVQQAGLGKTNAPTHVESDPPISRQTPAQKFDTRGVNTPVLLPPTITVRQSAVERSVGR